MPTKYQLIVMKPILNDKEYITTKIIIYLKGCQFLVTYFQRNLNSVTS